MSSREKDIGVSFMTFPMPMGDIYVHNGNTTTPIITQNAYTKVVVSTTLGTSINSFSTNGNGRFTYTGSITTTFHLGATISMKGEAGNDLIELVLWKNGTTNANGEFITGTELHQGEADQKTAATPGDVASTAVHVMSTLGPNEYVELAAKNKSGVGDVTITTLNIFGVGGNVAIP